MDIGIEAAQLPEKEYINGISVAVLGTARYMVLQQSGNASRKSDKKTNFQRKETGNEQSGRN